MTRSSAGLWKRSCTKCTTPVFLCLFVWVRIQAENSTQISSFPRVIYASNKWSSTRPLFTRTWSYSRTFDHFIAHVWVLPWHVSLFVRYEIFCLTRYRRNRCMAKSWSVPTVPSIFFSPNKLVCRGIKRFVTPAELRFYSIVFFSLFHARGKCFLG